MPAEFIFLSLSLIGAIYLIWLVTEVAANQHQVPIAGAPALLAAPGRLRQPPQPYAPPKKSRLPISTPWWRRMP